MPVLIIQVKRDIVPSFSERNLRSFTVIMYRAYDNAMLQNLSRVRTRGHPKNRLGSITKRHIVNTTKKKKKKVLIEFNGLQSNSSHYHGQRLIIVTKSCLGSF
ncbi:hypothetical protein Ahy_A07g036064 isoform B [Arachis hypogaea]|uniref:Uncharacterized protein n=1 Tax=Arachis hypogaea TaxID=3818 RepID=A0A445CF58_ARAHY|nr:hypothetical protein Ahy_A07g036064 isoform B [Arachis hypogaea]